MKTKRKTEIPSQSLENCVTSDAEILYLHCPYYEKLKKKTNLRPPTGVPVQVKGSG